MSNYKHIYILSYLLLAIYILSAQTLYNDVGHIPSSNQVEWHKAGLLKDCNSITPKKVFNINSFSGSNDHKVTVALDSARAHVNSTGGLSIVYFPAGDYLLFNTIELSYPDSNIVFQGDGSDSTTLKFQDLAGNPNYRCFNLSGGWWSNTKIISGNISKTDTDLTLMDTFGLSDNAWVHFFKPYYDYGVASPEMHGLPARIIIKSRRQL